MKRTKKPTAEEIEKLAQKINRESSSPEFRPFFIELDRKRARRIMTGKEKLKP